jgi:hypothetical protein
MKGLVNRIKIRMFSVLVAAQRIKIRGLRLLTYLNDELLAQALMRKWTLILLLMVLCISTPASAAGLVEGFKNPPDTAKPWVFWLWINGNISREGITKDLEAMKRVGIGGVLWMEVSGGAWAPKGPIGAGSREWHDAMQWAISEADRLGLAFALSVDFGYGSGGPHITPELSMQKLVCSETEVSGGASVTMKLKQPVVGTKPDVVVLRPGERMRPEVADALEKADSYRDVGVFALPASAMRESRLFPSDLKLFAQSKLKTIPFIPGIDKEPLMAFDGRGWLTHLPPIDGCPGQKPLASGDVIDLTDRMDSKGNLSWDAPPGDWTVVRLGHASNLHVTRPVPSSVLGLECDRLHPRGIDTHFEHRLKPILDAAGDKAGRTLQYIHIDSWEAYGQNWTVGFADEFRKRRGYDIRPWLPILTGHCVQSVEHSERFLWDMRLTVSEVTLANYIDRLRERIAPYGIRFSCEPYGRLCVNSLDYASRGDFIIAEFWTEREIKNHFPTFGSYWYQSMKGIASVANTYGKARVGAEAFTGCRGWVDHPYLIKGMGDEAFSEGVSHYAIHVSAHQSYDRMKPGLTHQRWGQHFNRHQTWWEFSTAWFDYVARSQFLLQQGRRIVDVACLYHEGAPLNFNNIRFELPPGHDYDLCTPEIIGRMTVEDGVLRLPTGVSYRYLALPRSVRLSLPLALKIEALRKAGASVLMQSQIVGTPGLEGYPENDREVKKLAAGWPLLKEGWGGLFAADGILPDFEGEGLKWIHRKAETTDLYFVANTRPEPVERECVFRVSGKTAELWNPETGDIHALPVMPRPDGCTRAVLHFEPAQSWFVVFRDAPSRGRSPHDPFAVWKTVAGIGGKWSLRFDPEWGTKNTLEFDCLKSWAEHSDPLVKYYSGTAAYRTTFDLPADAAHGARFGLDLGRVEVVARVSLNGRDCGIAWKPPYLVDITRALKPGSNELEIRVANTWVNRMIGDEQVPLDAEWKDWTTLFDWPDWFKQGKPSPTGRYTFTTARHYKKDSLLQPSGLLGPVRIVAAE